MNLATRCHTCDHDFGSHFTTNNKQAEGCIAANLTPMCNPDGTPKMNICGDGITKVREVKVKLCDCTEFLRSRT
jgi:hypothetical protein